MKSLPLPIRLAAGLAATAVERVSKLPEGIAGLPVTVASQALQLSMRVQQHVTELAIRGDEALASLRPVEDKPEWATFDEDEDSGDAGGAEVHEFLRREAKITHESAFRQRRDVTEPSHPGSPIHPLTRDSSAIHAQPAVRATATESVTRPTPDTQPDPAGAAQTATPAEPESRTEQSTKPTADVDADADAATVEPQPVEPESVEPDQRKRTLTRPEPSGIQRTPEPTAQPTGAPAGVTGFDEMSVAQLRGKLRTLSLQQLEELLEYERSHQARERFVTMLGNRVRTVREATD